MAADEQARLQAITRSTLAHYEEGAERYWQGTRDHDVSQNVAALLDALDGNGPFRILDLGCGPGRDLVTFRALGHEPVGLDGALPFVEMARRHSGAPVLHQDFLDLDLPPSSFDGVFANATLFHVPSSALPDVLVRLRNALRAGGVLFASNPRGDDREGWNGRRYGAYYELDTWRGFLGKAGFDEIRHYYRPAGLPRAEQPWLASLWRKPGRDR